MLHVAGMLAPLAKDLIVYCNGDESVTAAIETATNGRRVTIEPRKIASLECKSPRHPEILVNFDDGDTRTEAFMVSIVDPSEHLHVI